MCMCNFSQLDWLTLGDPCILSKEESIELIVKYNRQLENKTLLLWFKMYLVLSEGWGFLQPTSGWRSSQTTNCERKTYFENNGNYGEGGVNVGGWRSIDLGDDLSTRVTGEKTARQGREENVGEKEKNMMIWWSSCDDHHMTTIILS